MLEAIIKLEKIQLLILFLPIYYSSSFLDFRTLIGDLLINFHFLQAIDVNDYSYLNVSDTHFLPNDTKNLSLGNELT